jgi:hypothetical protein
LYRPRSLAKYTYNKIHIKAAAYLIVQVLHTRGLSPWPNVIKIFKAVNYECYKLVLVPGMPFQHRLKKGGAFETLWLYSALG